jgi:hypothetical protein
MALPDLGSVALAVGALGTASFALVDSTKIGRKGGISNSGFGFIQDAVHEFLLPGPGGADRLLGMLHGHWINGSALADQKAIAKSLIKLALAPDTAAVYARATRVDAEVLTEVAKNMVTGEPLSPQQANALGRFDLALTARLDEAYQRADQKYRNSARLFASLVSVVLALVGGWTVASSEGAPFLGTPDMAIAVLCGLLAVPFAPIAKDLASALQAGVKVAQTVRK